MNVQWSGATNFSVLLLRFRSSRQWDRVLDTAHEWLSQDPENVEAHLAAGQALINLKRHAEAASHLARALARSPEDSTAHRWLSIVQFHEKRYQAADESIHRALSLNPQDALNWYHLAWMLYKQGDLTSARKYASKARELTPRDPNTINLLALCTPNDRPATDVLRQYREALEIDPEKPVVHNNIGVYHLNVDKDYAAAEASFRRALFFDPTLTVARTNLFAVLKHRDRVYRLLCAPKDFVSGFFGLNQKLRKQNILLYLIALPLWLLAFRFAIVGLAVWFLLVWPTINAYEYLTIGDIRAQAGEIGARRGGLFGFRRWPLRVRLSLFGLLLAVFWGGFAWLCLTGDESLRALGFGLICLVFCFGLMFFLARKLAANSKTGWRRFSARRRAKKFDHLLPIHPAADNRPTQV